MKNKHNGWPVRWSALIVIIALWNCLFLCDYILFPKFYYIQNLGMFIAVVLLFIASIVIRKSEFFQKIVLKPGRKLTEIKYALDSATVASGVIMVVLFAKMFLSGHKASL